MTAGDVQWMTAGSGILHQEMPKGDPQGRMHGFQLWANLPASLKMTDPRYQDIPSTDIPEVTDDDGTRVRIICGEFWGKRGPVEGVAADPNYLDISVPPGQAKAPESRDHSQRFRLCVRGRRNVSRLIRTRRPYSPNNVEAGRRAHVRRRESLAGSLRSWRRGRGAGRAGRNSIPARIRQTARRTRSLVWAHRDEHARPVAEADPRTEPGNVHQTSVTSEGPVPAIVHRVRGAGNPPRQPTFSRPIFRRHQHAIRAPPTNPALTDDGRQGCGSRRFKPSFSESRVFSCFCS